MKSVHVIYRTLNERELAKKDNRNLYLLQEGFINEENRGTMNDRGSHLYSSYDE